MVTRCASAIKIVRPFKSRAETQPQLHPALLRLSAMISQCFTVPLLTIQHCLRHGFAQFKLCAHFLNLIGLLLEARGQGLNLLFLQSDHCRLSFSCGLQFLHNALLFEQLVCRVVVAGAVEKERSLTVSRVGYAGGVVKERRMTGGRVGAAGGIAPERIVTCSRVGSAGGVVPERLKTVGRVLVAGGVGAERKSTCSRVGSAGGVDIERLITVGRVGAAGGVEMERLI